MKDINRVILVGRMAQDAELKYTAGGDPVMNGNIAVTKQKKEGDQWRDEGHFFKFRIWGKLAEAVAQYCVKGRTVAIDGSLHLDRWKSQDGGSRTAVMINADYVRLLGDHAPTKPRAAQTVNQAANSSADFEDDIPF